MARDNATVERLEPRALLAVDVPAPITAQSPTSGDAATKIDLVNHFDESYDLEKDKDKRIDKIVKTCQDLLSRNWQDIYLQTQALRQHNHDTFFNREKLSIEINKTLELFLEFADSR